MAWNLRKGYPWLKRFTEAVISVRLTLLATKETQADEKVAGQTPIAGKKG